MVSCASHQQHEQPLPTIRIAADMERRFLNDVSVNNLLLCNIEDAFIQCYIPVQVGIGWCV